MYIILTLWLFIDNIIIIDSSIVIQIIKRHFKYDDVAALLHQEPIGIKWFITSVPDCSYHLSAITYYYYLIIIADQTNNSSNSSFEPFLNGIILIYELCFCLIKRYCRICLAHCSSITYKQLTASLSSEWWTDDGFTLSQFLKAAIVMWHFVKYIKHTYS